MEDEIELVERVYNAIVTYIVDYSFQLLGAAVVLIAGFIAARWLSNLVLKIQRRADIDETLAQFIANVVRVLIIAFVVIIVLGNLGISINPMIAAIGGAAVGLSLAIQGPVSNYGAGLVIIITRMFRIGDTITVQDCAGQVESISLANTTLIAEDGERVIIPNRHVVGEIHTNSGSNRIVAGSVGVEYAADPLDAIAVVTRAISASANTIDEPAPVVGIEEFGDSSINIGYRYWVPSGQFFQTQFAVNAAIYEALKGAQISIPFPQREVRQLG